VLDKKALKLYVCLTVYTVFNFSDLAMFAMIDWWPRKSKHRLERDIANKEVAEDGHNDTQNQ
jgi:hypothetical protein